MALKAPGKTAGALALFLTVLPAAAQAVCTDPPAPKVDWRKCDKSDADLSGAKLEGADLREAKLGGADLESTTWTDGRRCWQRSVATCKGDSASLALVNQLASTPSIFSNPTH